MPFVRERSLRITDERRGQRELHCGVEVVTRFFCGTVKPKKCRDLACIDGSTKRAGGKAF